MDKQFDLEHVRVLEQNIRTAQDELTKYLAQHFPKGYRCDVLLHRRQKIATPGTIRGVESSAYGGSIAVEIDGAKNRTRSPVRHLPSAHVLNVRPTRGSAE